MSSFHSREESAHEMKWWEVPLSSPHFREMSRKVSKYTHAMVGGNPGLSHAQGGGRQPFSSADEGIRSQQTNRDGEKKWAVTLGVDLDFREVEIAPASQQRTRYCQQLTRYCQPRRQLCAGDATHTRWWAGTLIVDGEFREVESGCNTQTTWRELPLSPPHFREMSQKVSEHNISICIKYVYIYNHLYHLYHTRWWAVTLGVDLDFREVESARRRPALHLPPFSNSQKITLRVQISEKFMHHRTLSVVRKKRGKASLFTVKHHTHYWSLMQILELMRDGSLCW